MQGSKSVIYAEGTNLTSYFSFLAVGLLCPLSRGWVPYGISYLHPSTSRMWCLCLWELELIHQDSVIKYYKELEALLTPSSLDAFLPCELFKVFHELPWGLFKRNSKSPSNMFRPTLSSKPAFFKHPEFWQHLPTSGRGVEPNSQNFQTTLQLEVIIIV